MIGKVREIYKFGDIPKIIVDNKQMQQDRALHNISFIFLISKLLRKNFSDLFSFFQQIFIDGL